MNSIEKFRNAIQERHPVRFTYNKPGKAHGIRIGNPHAIYECETKEGVKSIKVDIAQTGGVTDGRAPLPRLKMFDLIDLIIHEIDTDAVFQVDPDYRSDCEKYSNPIKKI
ncbi:MAG: hypothetical protein WC007_10640 [Pelobacteraceae bacterium]